MLQLHPCTCSCVDFLWASVWLITLRWMLYTSHEMIRSKSLYPIRSQLPLTNETIIADMFPLLLPESFASQGSADHSPTSLVTSQMNIDVPLIFSAYCLLTAGWVFSPGSSQANNWIFVWSLHSISIFTFVVHFWVSSEQLLIYQINDHSMGDFGGLTAGIHTSCKYHNKSWIRVGKGD